LTLTQQQQQQQQPTSTGITTTFIGAHLKSSATVWSFEALADGTYPTSLIQPQDVDVAVGDWVLLDTEHNRTPKFWSFWSVPIRCDVWRPVDRNTTLGGQRGYRLCRLPCNQDFNAARLERFYGAQYSEYCE
jgi:hypothetical protein